MSRLACALRDLLYTKREESSVRKHDGDQQGAQQHAEGEHGEKTHEAIINELEKGKRAPEAPSEPRHAGDVNAYGVRHPGKHRLDEAREQHDPAERGSESAGRERRED
jgi:hypothetical protein